MVHYLTEHVDGDGDHAEVVDDERPLKRERLEGSHEGRPDRHDSQVGHTNGYIHVHRLDEEEVHHADIWGWRWIEGAKKAVR